MTATTRRLLVIGVAVAALAALAATIGLAATRAGNGGNHAYGSMMNGSAYTMLGGDGQRTRWYLNGSGPVTTIAAARARAQQFADGLGLETGEVMQFASNFYVLLTDARGKPATEVLVDPETGAVTLEYGPAMMWNTRYGVMRGTGTSGYGGMMGDYGGRPTWAPSSGSVSSPLGVTAAQQLANEWLAREGSGQTAAQPDALPGYYTFHILKDGKITGMLSVNERTGAVWYHWWHGRFIAMEE
jgi:hypothetical protein